MIVLAFLGGFGAAAVLVFVWGALLAGRRRSGDDEEGGEARRPGPESDPPPASAPDLLLERAVAAIDGFRAAMQAYKSLADELEGRLAAQRTETEDWRAAAQYHAESVRRQQVEIAEAQGACLRLQQENAALRAAYVQRTQEALAAGLGRCVLRSN